MQINLVAIGTRMPSWVNEGYREYAHRLPSDYQLNLVEIEAQKRYKNSDIQKCLEVEGEALIKAAKPTDLIIALDRDGKSLNTLQLATQLQTWHDQSQDINLLIGGPEGIHPNCMQKAHVKWSLSALTLPHPLVRILIAEQIYRAYSIIISHPYHR